MTLEHVIIAGSVFLVKLVHFAVLHLKRLIWKYPRVRGEKNIIDVTTQMRMAGSEAVQRWIDALVRGKKVTDFPVEKDYEFKVFDNPSQMHEAIREKNATSDTNGLSRMLATFDWDFNPNASSAADRGNITVKAGNYSVVWNRVSNSNASRIKSWAEIPETINEVGSVFTIQGADLNYAGVIIGPSVKLVDGRVVFDAKESKHAAVRTRRTFSDGSKATVTDEIFPNELNILLTRGVHGLYVFAVDPALQAALKAASLNHQDAKER